MRELTLNPNPCPSPSPNLNPNPNPGPDHWPLTLTRYEGDESEETEPFVVAMMNYGTAIGGESESPNYYNNQAG